MDNNTAPMDVMLTEKDIARRLRCSPKTVARRMMQIGAPPCYVPFGQRLWKPDEFEKWFDGTAVTPHIIKGASRARGPQNKRRAA